MAKSAYQASDTNPITRTSAFYTVRQWSVRHSRGLERIYQMLAAVFLKLHPVWKAIGYRRVEKPVVVVEKTVKSFLFDCRMCGQCAGDNILQVQPPVDHSWRGSSAWLRATAKSAEEQAALKEGAGL